MKLPNGYGTIYKETRGNRRKRWQVKLPARYELVDGVSVCIRPALGWYATRAEAMRALAEYHKDPAYYNARTVTLAEIYQTWIKDKEMAENTASNYRSGWNNLAPLHEYPLSDLTVSVLEELLDKHTIGARRTMITLLNQLFNLAIARELIIRSPMGAIRRPKPAVKIKRTLFTPAEISNLWKNRDNRQAAYLLILLYSGMRALEPFTVIEDHGDYIIAGSKTKAGKGRIIPIHSKVRDLWISFREDSAGTKPDTYYQRVTRNKLIIGDHKVHDTRYTFISRMAALDVPELALQKIVGHSHNSITGDLYTIKEAPELCAYVEKLCFCADNPADNVRTTDSETE